jgi:hypothetical protein
MFVVACVAALLTCSCASQAELDKARAEAAAAREEAERAKAELDDIKAKDAAALKAKEDAQKDKEKAKQKAAALEEEMRTRWNAVAAAAANVPLPNFGQVNFTWRGPDAFPHPTFKGGSKEAYTAFAKVLVAFLETGDNFEFMQKNGLFTAEIGFGLNGKVKLGEFAESLAKPGSLGAGDEENRKKLEALVAKMKTPQKV